MVSVLAGQLQGQVASERIAGDGDGLDVVHDGELRDDMSRVRRQTRMEEAR